MMFFHHFYLRKINNKVKTNFFLISKNVKAAEVLVFIDNPQNLLILKNLKNLIYMRIKKSNNKLLFQLKLNNTIIKTF
jgi:hypothetical protein